METSKHRQKVKTRYKQMQSWALQLEPSLGWGAQPRPPQGIQASAAPGDALSHLTKEARAL